MSVNKAALETLERINVKNGKGEIKRHICQANKLQQFKGKNLGPENSAFKAIHRLENSLDRRQNKDCFL